MEKIVTKKKAGHVVEMQLDSFKTLYGKQLFKKLTQILNDPTHPMRHYFDNATGVENIYSLKQI